MRVPRSGYYAWLKEPQSNRNKEDERLFELIQGFYEASGQSYGSPRITKDLREMGERCGKNRVARLMKQAGLKAKTGYKRPRYKAGRAAKTSDNLLRAGEPL